MSEDIKKEKYKTAEVPDVESKEKNIECPKSIQQEEILIKQEPLELDPGYLDTSDQDVKGEVNDLLLKLEPEEFSNEIGDESASEAHPVFLIKRPKRKKEDSDEEYIPPDGFNGTFKVPKSYQKNRAFKTTKDIMYPDEVTRHIKLVTITEEQRQAEYLAALESRRGAALLCEWCAIGHVDLAAHDQHMKIHQPEAGEHECDVCHSRFKTAHILYYHRLRHFRRYRCNLCWSLTYKDKDSAAAHVMKDHAGEAFVCAHCDKAFRRPQYLKSHINQAHTKPKVFKCPVCDKECYDRARYRCHVRNHKESEASGQPTTCSICQQRFETRAELSAHAASHDERPECTLCNKTYKNSDLLRLHLRRVHAREGGFPCSQCDRVLTTHVMLQRHMLRIHVDRTKKFQCDHCQRLYYSKAEVRAHIAWSHLRAAPHACWCGARCRSPARLRAHVARAHLRQPPVRAHACPHCAKAFETSSLVKRHMRVHTDETFPCLECGAKFKTEAYVKVHHQLRHLHMTRQEIRASTRRRPLDAPCPSLPSAVAKPQVKKSMKSRVNDSVETAVDPLLCSEDTDPGAGADGGVHIPLFETFIDVIKEPE